MSEQDGGGASRSTDPASGSSAATDISLREYLEALRTADEKLASERFRHLRELGRVQLENEREKVKTALESSKELAEKHNDLIRAGEKKDDTYATKDDLTTQVAHVADAVNRLSSWQAKMQGGLLVVAFIGIANLVKIWLT